ncbi:MAG: Blue-light-activated protein [bacterium ADurb.Bin363]|nr:MAG: Blue-light-activated protein [bacterium ADurb.Bin363]
MDINLILIENSEDNALSIIRELNHRGYKTLYEIVSDPESIVKALIKEPRDIIIADYSVPEVNSLKIMNLLKENNLDIPLIIISEIINEDIAVEVMKSGARDYIIKDNFKRLLPVIERELGELKIKREKIKSEKELIELKRQFSTLMNILPGMTYRCRNDTDWTMDFLSEGCFSLTGYKPSHLIGNKKISYNNIIRPQDREFVWNQVQDAVKEKKPFQMAYRIITSCGEEKYVWEQGQGIFSDKEELLALEGFISDITPLKRSEEALRNSEYSYRTLTENLPGIVYRIFIKENYRMQFFNNMLETMTGFKPEELRKGEVSYIDPLILSEDRPDIIKIIHNSIRDNKPFQIEYRLMCKKGLLRYFLERSRPVYGEDGKPLYIDGVIFDITETKKAEEALKESESRNRALLKAIPDFMFILDKNGVFVDYNTNDPSLLYVPPEEFMGKHISDVMPEEIVKSYITCYKKALETGETQYLEYSLFIDGKDKYFEERLALCDKDKVLAVIRDITERKIAEKERKKLEAQLQHTQKLESLGVLAGGIAHDFNNILTGILGYADLALMDISPVSPAIESIQNVVTAAKRAAELTKQMLAYSGKGKFMVQKLQLSEIVEEMSHLLEVSISKKCILKYNFAQNLLPLEGDATQIRQIIMNLITNASEAIGERSGVIAVTTGMMDCDRAYLSECYLDENLPEGLYVYIEVADTGCGMTKEIQNKIFDPFFTTKFTGRGLGLAAVIGIVRSHKGVIKIYSEPLRGTTFKVMFPVIKLQIEDTEKEKTKQQLWSGQGTILVIDDEKTVRTVAKAMLNKLGFNVITAEGGREGIEIFISHKEEINAVLLDMTMPDMDGEETYRELRRVKSNIKVILSSGYNEQEATDRFSGKGLSGFIQKPYRVDELMETLQKIMEQ